MSALPLAGVVFAALFPGSLLIAFGLLHYVQLRKQAMSVFDDLKALAAEFVAAVEELKGLDVAGFAEKVKADAEALANAAETELHNALPDLQAGVAGVKSFIEAVKAQIEPPAPVAEPAPAEQPAA